MTGHVRELTAIETALSRSLTDAHARIDAAVALHDSAFGICQLCHTPDPCATVRALRGPA